MVTKRTKPLVLTQTHCWSEGLGQPADDDMTTSVPNFGEEDHELNVFPSSKTSHKTKIYAMNLISSLYLTKSVDALFIFAEMDEFT